MKRSSVKFGLAALASVAMLGACDANNVLLWPWVEIAAREEEVPEDPTLPPPPPPLDAVDPVNPTDPGAGGVPTRMSCPRWTPVLTHQGVVLVVERLSQ